MNQNEKSPTNLSESSEVNPSEKSMPDAFIILFFVVMLVAIATHFIPAGKFEVQQNGTETVLLADSFQFVDNVNKVTLFAEQGEVGFFNFAFEGMVSGDRNGSAIGVMMFIILTGGAFGIIMKTGAIDNGVLALIDKTQKLEVLFIPILFILFSLAGAIFGMGEEAIAFCIVLLPLLIAIGYDGVTTVLVTYVATQIGFAASWMNPFSVAIAQGIAGIPLMSGLEFRVVMWLVFTVIGVVFTMRYAAKIKKNPTLSPSFYSDKKHVEESLTVRSSPFSYVDGSILLVFLLGIIWVIWGVLSRSYYIAEIASQFFTLGCVIGFVAILLKRLTVNQVAESFKKGAQELLPAAMIVGMAKGIVILMGGDDPSTPSVLNSVLFYAGQAIGDLPQTLSATLMFVFQAVFNFFIASGSGQAALTMPLMSPLSDIVGVSRQVAVLAFQLGDGLTNIIVPTSAALIGCLGIAKIDWLVWAKFIVKFMVVLMSVAIAFVIAGVLINLK